MYCASFVSRHLMDTPQLRLVSLRMRYLNECSDLALHTIRLPLKANPRNSSWEAFTPWLFSWFTFNLSFVSRNRCMLTITRSPARWLFTRMTFRAKRQDRSEGTGTVVEKGSSSPICYAVGHVVTSFLGTLSRSSNTMFANNGDRGPPCGTPSLVRCSRPSTWTPARRYLPMRAKTRLSCTLLATRTIRTS